jgi:hypothetical protein
MIENETTCQLPPDVFPEGLRVRKETMTFVLPLRPVSNIVDSNNAERARHSNKDPDVYKDFLDYGMTLIGSVDHHPVQSGTCGPRAKRDTLMPKTAQTHIR